MTMPKSDARHLDHFVFVPKDLDAAAKTYERLGFQVLPKMRHLDFGSCNQVIQLGDNYLEFLGDLDLIEASEHRKFYTHRRDLGAGLSNFSYSSEALDAERERLMALAVSCDPKKSASRFVVMPDGSQQTTQSNFFYTHNDAAPYQSPFFSEHLKPETIFVPKYQIHPNGALSVTGAICASLDPARDAAYLAKLGNAVEKSVAAGSYTINLSRGHMATVLSQGALFQTYGDAASFNPDTKGCVVGLEIAIESQSHLAALLRGAGIEFHLLSANGGERLCVSAQSACGVMLLFKETDSSALSIGS